MKRLGPWGGPLLATLVLLGVYWAGHGLDLSRRGLSDALSLAAILLLVIGLFRLVNRWGTFSSLGYGYQKLEELIRTRDYTPDKARYTGLSDYRQANPYTKDHRPYLLAAALELCLALLLAG